MTTKSASIESAEARLLVGLYVYGDDLRPDLVSSRLQGEPTRSQRRGDIKASRSGDIPAKVGLWEMTSTIQSPALGDHLDHLLSRIGRPDVFIPSIDGVEEVHLDVFVSRLGQRDGYRRIDLELDLPRVSALATLGASLRISVVDSVDR